MPPLPDFSALRVLVVGDVMIDRYLSGRVDRISPEAPVPVVRMLRREDRLGGAANVALNLVALGARTEIAGAVGTDAAADELSGLLRERGMNDRLLLRDAARVTTVKTRIISQSQQLLRVDQETTDDLSAAVTQSLLSAMRSEIAAGAYDLIILQDYNKGVLTPTLISGVLEMAKAVGVPTAVDPKHANFWAFGHADLFKPNLREIQLQVDFPLEPRRDSLDRAAQIIVDRLGCRRVMITLSEHGIYTFQDGRGTIYPTDARRIADVSGAGDTVISVAGCALAAGMELADAARLANLAGAQVISRPGVVAVDLPELRTAWRALS